MARQASGKAEINLRIEERTTDVGYDGAGVATAVHEVKRAVTFENGVLDGQIDRVFSGANTATTTPTNLDLVGTGLASQVAGGAPNSFADLQILVIENTGTVGNLIVGGGASAIPLTNGTTDGEVVQPGGVLYRNFGTAGLALTAGVADILKIVASAGTVPYRILLAGRSS